MDSMRYLYLLNAAMYAVIGAALLLVWRRHRTQAFAHHMGCSTLFAALIPLAYLIHTTAPEPVDASAGKPIALKLGLSAK